MGWDVFAGGMKQNTPVADLCIIVVQMLGPWSDSKEIGSPSHFLPLSIDREMPPKPHINTLPWRLSQAAAPVSSPQLLSGLQILLEMAFEDELIPGTGSR